MFKVLDKKSNEYMAIKVMKFDGNEDLARAESSFLKDCVSAYLVKYYDVLLEDNRLQVMVLQNAKA